MATAIDELSGKQRADIINLSLGFDWSIPDLADSIEDAADNGTLCICAGGNSGGKPPVFPANLSSVIGVGGIGFEGVAPKGTFVERSAQRSAQRGGWGALFPTLGHAFHDSDTCHGDGIDVCGPSIGIIMRQPGDFVGEYHGTSYAAPIVAGVLAAKLAQDVHYRELAGRKRYSYAREVLIGFCCNIGLDARKVGSGLPQL